MCYYEDHEQLWSGMLPYCFCASALPAVRGMKFGYEMKSSTIVAPYKTSSSGNTYSGLLTTSSRVDQLAKEACTLLGTNGYAVIDYMSRTAHAVPASDAVERYMPSFNYIDCSKVN